MNVALKYNIGFPSGATKFGLTPSKYVACYETNKPGNKNPKTVVYLAKNKVYWNRITLSDANQINELQPLFKNKEIVKVISFWYKNDETFCKWNLNNIENNFNGK